ncbi:hypothetical protein K458DRAFT_382361 [Lentithecium fluviatile CBS 122367]|uniref:Uncharacterized protein n=1 Tax=Lentithecium fluviatile CBS 122367 TaxID=1168545 RepID=A0A6G1JKV5_9PLEO|nr:hypothetical protein K458DRAFT_382361 [Lentithecium fluviatile CBS 122367]
MSPATASCLTPRPLSTPRLQRSQRFPNQACQGMMALDLAAVQARTPHLRRQPIAPCQAASPSGATPRFSVNSHSPAAIDEASMAFVVVTSSPTEHALALQPPMLRTQDFLPDRLLKSGEQGQALPSSVVGVHVFEAILANDVALAATISVLASSTGTDIAAAAIPPGVDS